MSSFEGKVYAVTGAASGIGLAIARALAKKGAIVSLSDVNAENLKKAVDSLEGGKAKHMTAVVDVRKSADVDKWIADTVSKHGQLDGAANIAGIGPRTKAIRDITDEDWSLVNEINVQGMFHSLRAELKNMKNGGAIVNACSVAGLGGNGGSAEYIASKHGCVGMTKCAAREERASQIRINGIAPGAIDTPLLRAMETKLGFKDGNRFPLTQPVIQRFGTAEEMANVAVFLLSDEASFVTGSVWTADGGWIC
jgi:NAD(P)-dependent dehydrogenase (short-subunit alcohol dehydrogenase family)